ncbi:MAG: hypothetical protein ACOYMI_11080, partial [Phycisphaerales bacterium]
MEALARFEFTALNPPGEGSSIRIAFGGTVLDGQLVERLVLFIRPFTNSKIGNADSVGAGQS